jgi:hypothetical protein
LILLFPDHDIQFAPIVPTERNKHYSNYKLPPIVPSGRIVGNYTGKTKNRSAGTGGATETSVSFEFKKATGQK